MNVKYGVVLVAMLRQTSQRMELPKKLQEKVEKVDMLKGIYY